MPEVAGVPGADGTGAAFVAALDGDAPFIVQIGPPDLEEALEGLDPVRCAVVRIGNPLNAPLTPQRILLQLALDGEEGAGGDEADRLLRTVAVRAAGRPCLLVVVEQAETLTPAALALLQLLPDLRGPAAPSVRVAFHGTPAFRALLEDPRFRPIQGHDSDAPSVAPARRPLWKSRRGAVLGVVSVTVLLLAAPLLLPRRVATAPAASAPPSLSPAANASPVTEALPAPPPPVADGPVAGGPAAASPGLAPQPGGPSAEAAASSMPRPPSAVAEDPAAARSRLYREFNAFVETRGLAGRLARSDREALFREYLARRYAAAAPAIPNPGPPAPSTPASVATTPAEPVPTASAGPEVVLFFHAGPPDAQARADENAALLRHYATDVTLRPAPDGPAQPTVRYFRPDDRDLAIAIALTLPPTTPDWQVVDLSTAADRPVRPTIEVWLPGMP